MLGLKKKLSALVPTDARSSLQKALTVEWDGGHKAVLVDLAPPEAHPDVEMAGLKKQYGRLPDEDEEEAMFRAWDAAEEERARQREKEARTRRMVQEALGAPRKAESVLGLDASDFQPPSPREPAARPEERRSNNPFAAPYRHDEGVDAYMRDRRPAALGKTWAWEGRSGEPSPTTSSGSRSSGSSGDLAAHPENPFR
ncbi:hypothetical protein CC85DRAFT_302086 [Cutaneotrichosporon oleaginosum]|uniref:Uncharacterized protein n=1 Tax=Cutaneotrichosporon oleaginosum TaxID=879819 RepID=A0A0J0XNW1_9TREE|nr:uncharacterized protein CC85DRAFT_302086 [Cutaneotrichosporon oleaginosum]KLT42762.1 hypothetical protein CC85DRAFT_302086 [Cutaneotrichosporon oleaginosum]TXT09520.1 hypothetical protein COLE_03454 [Cutaneotrichosporon oleaginosum]